MFIVKMEDAYGGEFFGFGDTIELARKECEDNAGDTLELVTTYTAEEVKVKKVIEYQIIN